MKNIKTYEFFNFSKKKDDFDVKNDELIFTQKLLAKSIINFFKLVAPKQKMNMTANTFGQDFIITISYFDNMILKIEGESSYLNLVIIIYSHPNWELIGMFFKFLKIIFDKYKEENKKVGYLDLFKIKKENVQNIISELNKENYETFIDIEKYNL